MKYFIDTEFLEGPQKKTLLGFNVGETKPTIDLISIGIVTEDGREFYEISKDFNLEEAWNRYQINHELGSEPETVYWIRENVLKPIWRELFLKQHRGVVSTLDVKNGKLDSSFTYKSFRKLIKRYGKTNKEIAEDIKRFVDFEEMLVSKEGKVYKGKPEFYAYYADYDWVVFAQLFGTMMDLPAGFPMYCRDLKQTMDEKERIALSDVKIFSDSLKKHPNYPKQENEHNALADARWNHKLYNFLQCL